MTAIAVQHREKIIQGVSEGRRLSELGQPLGVTPQAISKALKDDPEYRQAIEAGHAARLDMAEEMIENAADAVDVTRARSLWAAYAWRAEREYPSRWGTKSSGEAQITVLVFNPDRPPEHGRVIENAVVQQLPNSSGNNDECA